MKALKRKIKRAFNCFSEKKRLKVMYNKEISWGGGTGIEVNLLFLAHSLEKGMGLPSPKSYFGLEKAVSLLEMLEKYISEGLDKNSYAFVESLSALDAYLTFTDNDCSAYSERFQKIRDRVEHKNAAGYREITDMNDIYEKLNIEQIDYFIRTRHSIRSYEQTTVDEDTWYKILLLASKAPSACNRQPVKVYWTSVLETVNKVNELIPGNQGFENQVPNWAIVAVDREMFGVGEPLQWYVNGGIFLSYLVGALHAYKLGSCIFQIPATHKNTVELRQLAGIPDNEAVVAAVGFGVPKKENKFLEAARRPVSEILVRF